VKDTQLDSGHGPQTGQEPGTAELGDVLLGAAGACGFTLEGVDAAAAAARIGAPQAAKACVVLVDGLGWHNLMARADLAPFFSGAAPVQARSAFPSTTATNLAYLGTGERAGSTGMLGYTVRGPNGGLLNLVSWNSDVSPQAWQQHPTVFERLEGAGAVAISIGPWRFADSGLTRAALRGAEYSPAQSLPERVDTALSHLRDPEVDLVYLYWGEVDSAGHEHGWRSQTWGEELAHLDTQLQRLDRLLPAGTLLIVTADHGMVDVPANCRIDVAEHEQLLQDVDLIGGEPRAVHVYTRPGKAEQVARRWSQTLGERARVLSRAALTDTGLLGPVARRHEAAIGDVVVIAQGEHAVVDSRQRRRHGKPMIGMHGALSAQECTVPLLCRVG